jgi:hypothetical protein
MQPFTGQSPASVRTRGRDQAHYDGSLTNWKSRLWHGVCVQPGSDDDSMNTFLSHPLRQVRVSNPAKPAQHPKK